MSTALPGLIDGEEYVRRIFEQMRTGKLDQVRIGVRSGVERPDYILNEFFADDGELGPGQPVPMEAYSGKTHRPVSYARWENADNWSIVGMTTAEVQRLLGEIRGWTSTKKRSAKGGDQQGEC
ncbi:MAG: hypothetical protein EOS70_32635 [Mesorhizobium sp.]|uniref:hypothetical protein n=1 Tax=Mesorhizobium sp. TaxID=1871066 RepID=UPI000FE8C0FB|nr:hypothetical protein [Mesorhizobium sp.]RWC25956.1 MAG: hypothetical protein EOS70_32635 [Mesorhizobium sp.]